MKRKKKNKLWMLQAVLCAVCILSAVLLYQDYVAIPRQNRELVEELKTCFPEDIPPGGGSPGEKEEQAGREPEVSAVDLRSLQRQYPGVRGWLTIPEVGIDYPFMQSSRENPEYYLRRDYRGNYDINGSLFLQADCILGESKNLTIYGHNMNSGAMFGNLDLYAGEDYYNAHRFAYLQTEDGIQEYKIVTVLKADRNLFPFQQKLPDVVAVQEYLKVAKRREVFETGDDYLKCIYDKVLTLVTCSYEWSGARNIVLAVPVSGAVWSQKCS